MWPWLNLKSGWFSVSPEAGSSSLDLTLCNGFLVEAQFCIVFCTTKVLNQCHGNPLTTTVLKCFLNLGKKLHTRGVTMNPRSECRPPVCLVTSRIKPNSNLNKIFTHPAFSEILCWFPPWLWEKMDGAILPRGHPATPPADISCRSPSGRWDPGIWNNVICGFLVLPLPITTMQRNVYS